MEGDKLDRQGANTLDVGVSPTIIDLDVAAVRPPKLCQALLECSHE